MSDRHDTKEEGKLKEKEGNVKVSKGRFSKAA